MHHLHRHGRACPGHPRLRGRPKDVDARHKAGQDELDGIDEKTQAALSQIGREEKAAAADEVSPIVRHRGHDEIDRTLNS
jgi:hypothetical protein